MIDWRNTNWRQGSICEKTSLSKALPEDIRKTDCEFFITASHDCDIANADMEKEPFIELFPVEIYETPDHACLHGKNPRRLCVEILKDNSPSYIGIEANKRFFIKKADMEDAKLKIFCDLDYKGKRIFQSWLAARYRRHAFPNSLMSILENTKFWEKLVKKSSSQVSEFILQYLLHYEPDYEIEGDDRYELELLVVHKGTEEARDYAIKLARDLEKLSQDIGGIDFSRCWVASPAEVTMQDLGYYERLYLDYVSYKYDNNAEAQDFNGNG